jgi:hypothetical protein
MEDGIGIVGMLVYFAVIIVLLAGYWKVFEKAGEPGWGAIVPIYNLYIMLKIAGKPAWWLILMLIPFVNLVVAIMVNLEIAKRFGKSDGFGIGLALLSIIFYPILGFGDAVYQGGNGFSNPDVLDSDL